jgi:TRAP-type transport system periplasmic protein
MINKKTLLYLTLAVLLLLVAGCGTQDVPVVDSTDDNGEVEVTPDEAVTLSLGGIQSVDDAASRGMEMLAQLANEKSGGTLEVQTFPASQLGDATSQLEAVFLGSQDMFIDAQSWMTQYVPEKSIEAMFFTFDDQEHYTAFIESDLHSELEEELLALTGARTIANNWFRLPRVMASKRPIYSLDDLQGLKMRVPDIKGYMFSVQALGISPTQIPWGEVYLSLQQGVVDACEGPQDSMYTMKFYEPTKHITMTNHIRDNLAIWINEDVFQRLSENQQQALVEAALEAGEWYSQTVRDEVQGYFDIMEEDGTEFIEIDIQPLKELTMQAALDLEEDGEWRSGFYEAVQALAR